MNLNDLFGIKDQLRVYPERQFAPFRHAVGLNQPVVFVSSHSALDEAQYFSLTTTEDTGYTIYMVSFESGVLLYLIDVKTSLFKLTKNGLIIRTRKRWNEATDSKGFGVRYQLNDFVVLSNANQTAAIFARDISTVPKT